jgi:hypothetical protein
MRHIPFVFATAIAAACSGGPVLDQTTHPSAATTAAAARLSGIKTFFAHQSVGGNILEGIATIVATPGVAQLRIEETTDPTRMLAGTVAHVKVGTNGDPRSKLLQFESLLNQGIGEQADVALLKFCYADIDTATDVGQLLTDYTRVMAGLRQRFPSLLLVHVTVPLQRAQSGPKAWLKRASGRAPGGYLSNARREDYNAILRARFGGKEPIFDLAAAESRAMRIDWGGRLVPALDPALTNDGGHLNREGQLVVAGTFLEALDLATAMRH